MAPPDPSPPADLGLVDALVQLSFAVQGILAAIAARHELSITQVRMLGVLRDREPGMLELARFLGLEKSSVTGLVDRAQRRELVARTAPGHDGRAVHVRLTPTGREIARGFAAEVEARLAALAGGLTASERDQLSRLASRLVARA
jgi:DNA-binding MarR family transcriptional regulator